jgi:ABC-type dipeptide/oligopeptide/nickel transport system ATPase component
VNTSSTSPESPLLTIEDLAVSFAPRERGAEPTRAVQGVSLTVYPRQTLAIVGESGCGKSVTAMSITRLNPTPPAVYEGGRIMYAPKSGGPAIDLLSMPEKQLRRFRGGEIAMIFQEPMTSLNPVYTVGDQVLEAVLLHRRVSGREAWDIARSALEEVGIQDAATRMGAYPHEFSGGMRQRVMIAMALACQPRLLIADEPTTALDVTIQAQILELLEKLKRERGLGIVFITHALGVVAEHADVACVMYAGKVVEYATVPELFERPLHPYTRGLLKCIPSMTERRTRLTTIKELMDDPSEFARGVEGISAGAVSGPGGTKDGKVVPWWPAHTPPAGSGGASSLIEVSDGHWVRIWGDTGGTKPRRPDLAFRRHASPVATAND